MAMTFLIFKPRGRASAGAARIISRRTRRAIGFEQSAGGTGRRVWRALTAWSRPGSNTLTAGRQFDKAAWGSRSMNQEPAARPPRVRRRAGPGRRLSRVYPSPGAAARHFRLGAQPQRRRGRGGRPRRRCGRRSASRRDAQRAARGRGHEFAHRRTQRGRGRSRRRAYSWCAQRCSGGPVPRRRIRRRPIHA